MESRQAAESGDEEGIHLTALVDVAFRAEDQGALDRAVSRLESLSSSESSATPAVSDLAAAYLARATAQQSPQDLYSALDYATRAIDQDSTYLPALFNHAIALQRLHLGQKAVSGWKRYLRADSTSGWAGEARREMAALLNDRAPPEPTLDEVLQMADGATLTSWASEETGHSRILVLEQLLPAWGESVLDGDTASATRHLQAAQLLGGGARESPSDPTIARTLATLETLGPSARRDVAEGFMALGRGADLNREGKFALSVAPLDRATELLGQHNIWAGLHAHLLATIPRVYAGDLDEAEARFDAAKAIGEDRAQTSMVAFANWGLGLCAVLRGQPGRALNPYRAAQSAYQRLGEREHEGTQWALATEALDVLGRNDEADRAALQALRRLGRYHTSARLHNTIHLMARMLSARGLDAAARAVQEEGVLVAAGARRPQHRIEALTALARIHVGAGEPERARMLVMEGRNGLTEVSDSVMLQRLSMDLLRVEAEIELADHREEALAKLSRVADHFESRRNFVTLLEVVSQRAKARLAFGDSLGAADDLERSVSLIEQNLASLTNPFVRALLLDDADVTYDALVDLYAKQQRWTEAIEVAERGRRVTMGLDTEISAKQNRSFTLAYSLLSDRLLIWNLSGPDAVPFIVPVGREEVRARVEALTLSLEVGGDWTAASNDLWRWLVAPVAASLPSNEVVRIIPDDVLHRVPFGALLDDEGSLVAERFTTLIVASAAAQPHSTTDTLGIDQILVASPTFDQGVFPSLAPLPAAEQEAADLAALYPQARHLVGPDASESRLLEAFEAADLIHFAGHAVYDETDPTRSFLVTASDSNGSGRITSPAIRQLSLKADLVILSACTSAGGAASYVGGVGGIGASFLAAGAKTVIGSVWSVPDQASASFMAGLHARLASGTPATEALRASVVEAFRDQGELGDPRSWMAWQAYGS